MLVCNREIDGSTVKARCSYTESKVYVTSKGDLDRREFYWGDENMYRDELEAIKAALAFVDGLEE